ncbi:hypothetical protein ACU6U9_21900 [Pseudomonas sp. HK3]
MCTYAIATTPSNQNQNYLGANIEIQPNTITRLKLPIKSLKGSHLNTGDVLPISFKDKGSITIYSITKESIGFSVDMRDYPKHIMGLKKTDQKNEYANLICTTIKDVSVTYQPLKTALFRTHNGDG